MITINTKIGIDVKPLCNFNALFPDPFSAMHFYIPLLIFQNSLILLM